MIRGNYLGLTPAGGADALGNGGRRRHRLRRSTTIAGNVISANAPNIWILGPANGGSDVRSPATRSARTSTGLIGLGAAAASSSRQRPGNVIGGTTPAEGNLISGTNGSPIKILGSSHGERRSRETRSARMRTARLPCVGELGPGHRHPTAQGNLIGGSLSSEANEIAFNRGDGRRPRLRLGGAELDPREHILETRLGIDLRRRRQASVVTPNDPVDADAARTTCRTSRLHRRNERRRQRRAVDARREATIGSSLREPHLRLTAATGKGQMSLGTTSRRANPDGFTAWGVELSGGLNNGDA